MSRCRSLVVASLAIGAAWSQAAAPAEAAPNREFGARPLAKGTKGRDVRILQDFLSRAGVGTPVDGQFGATTRRKLRSWERRRLRAAGASAGQRAAAGVWLDGRLSTSEAQLLRQDVEAAEAGQTPAGATPAQPAPAPVGKATIGADGLAVAPADAPEVVRQIIAAGNEIHSKPYKYGGGHGRWEDSGYDCSGSMSYAFHGAGLLDQALDSSGFARWGEAAPGQWVTIYANSGHSFMVVAGLRFDTSGREDAGSRWQTRPRSTDGYAVRHPQDL